MKSGKVFFYSMYVVLIGIGLLQFLELPKTINYILGIIAICFGIIGCITKFTKNSDSTLNRNSKNE